MKLWELGEFALIERIAQLVGSAKGKVIVGIGDDTAVLKGDSSFQLATTDSLMEGIHFHRNEISWEELGWKALAVNLSDIAAMGGIPHYALVTLALPKDVEVEDVLSLYKGILGIAELYEVATIGGDLISSLNIVVTITLLGSLERKSFLTRSHAHPGDQIGITGYLGSSAGGLKMLRRGLNLEREIASFLRQAHFRPLPRVREGRILTRHGVRTAIDISDGLLSDLGHICRMSKVGAKVRVAEVPIHPWVKSIFGEEVLSLALCGGEDYELLFTAPPQIMKRVSKEFPFTVIGNIVEGEGIELVDEKGNPFPWQEKGWEHFV
jgi:thiamine-monophosphate kinase